MNTCPATLAVASLFPFPRPSGDLLDALGGEGAGDALQSRIDAEVTRIVEGVLSRAQDAATRAGTAIVNAAIDRLAQRAPQIAAEVRREAETASRTAINHAAETLIRMEPQLRTQLDGIARRAVESGADRAADRAATIARPWLIGLTALGGVGVGLAAWAVLRKKG